MPPKRKRRAALQQSLVVKAKQVQALSDVLVEVRRKRFEIDQSTVVLTDEQRTRLAREYDTARDAYYRGLSEFIDSSEPSIGGLLQEIEVSRGQLQALQVSQQTAVAILDGIASLVGLAGKLLVLGSA